MPFSERVIIAPEVIVRILGDESVLLNPKTGLYFGLDAVGTRMWTALTSSESIEVAYDALLAEYDVENGQLRRDLEDLVSKLLEQQLIELKPPNGPVR